MWVIQGGKARERRENTRVASFCDKASPTTGVSEYFDHNLCGTFNGAEVMS